MNPFSARFCTLRPPILMIAVFFSLLIGGCATKAPITPPLGLATKDPFLRSMAERLARPTSIPPATIELTSDCRPLAFATPLGTIHISIGLIQMTTVEAELAFVLAHEFSHIALKHDFQERTKEKELAADYLAAQLLQKGGWNARTGTRAIVIFNDPHASASDSHPTIEARMRYIEELRKDSGLKNSRAFRRFQGELPVCK